MELNAKITRQNARKKRKRHAVALALRIVHVARIKKNVALQPLRCGVVKMVENVARKKMNVI